MCCNSHSCRVNKNNRCELNQTHYLTPPCHTPSHYTVDMHCAAAPLPTLVYASLTAVVWSLVS